jgi:adenylate cyclase
MAFVTELKRRKVLHVGAIYAVTAWVLVQVVATIKAPLNLPGWSDTLVIVLLGVGFPVALILSWAYNLSAEGIVRDTGAAAAVAPQRLPNSIAVLPFENLSPNADDAFFAAGIHEQLLNELAKIRDISVIARTSVLRFAKDPPPVPEIAATLNVETVMEGSVRYAGEKVRVTAQLIDGTSGAHLWTEAYDGDLSDVFSIQTEIATRITRSLQAELLPDTKARLETPPTASPAAYALFLAAASHAQRSEYAAAEAQLDQAIRLDPGFALALAAKGYIHAWRLVNGFVAAPADAATGRSIQDSALDYADRALAIDAGLGVAWSVRATVHRLTFRWRSAREEFGKALELAPNDPRIVSDFALFLAETGERERAMAMAERQTELNPLDSNPYASLVMVAAINRRFDVALRAARIAHEMSPGHPLPNALLGHASVGLHSYGDAASHYATAEALVTDETAFFLPAIIYGYGLMDRSDDARRLYRRFEKWAGSHPAGAGGWIFSYLGVGEVDKAYEWLGRVVEVAEAGEPDPGYFALAILSSNAHDDPVLGQPRFRGAFERILKIALSR